MSNRNPERTEENPGRSNRNRPYRIQKPAGSRGAARGKARSGMDWGAQEEKRFLEGKHSQLYRHLGAHPQKRNGTSGTRFRVWAPAAERVAVIGSHNHWNPDAHPMTPSGASGVWETWIAEVAPGTQYKYQIRSRQAGHEGAKADPFAFRCEHAPDTASVVADLTYRWSDAAWLEQRRRNPIKDRPMSIYEMHLGSWRRPEDQPDRFYSYRELAEPLCAYLKETGFTHVEFLPVMEHPFYGSWGYQVTGYFAATSRYGSPQDLMYLIDQLHQHGIGVVLDWVPSHFPTDAHGLAFFDGTHLFEYADPKLGFQPEWQSYTFNYGRPEVQSFLLSSARFWIEQFHIDAIRVDAVASMLHLDYGRKEGEWVQNKYGGRENLEAVQFVRRLNVVLREAHPDVPLIAEESTSWPGVTRPPYLGGLGFEMKWDMGWMHDTLEYFKLDPIHRRNHQDKITFRQMYANSERFLLPLSHDEVVHGKASMIAKMAGDEWQSFANLRALYAYMWALPGKKLLFMGGEFGQWREWNHDAQLEWSVLQYPFHNGLKRWVSDLNALYRECPALAELDYEERGFSWVDCSDTEQSVIVFLRHAKEANRPLLVVGNFTPVPREGYRIGVPLAGRWVERLNSDAEIYSGSGFGNFGEVRTESVESHGQAQSLKLTLPPLSVLFMEFDPRSGKGKGSREPAESTRERPSNPSQRHARKKPS